MQKWISIACASVLFIVALCGVLFLLFHPTAFRAWLLITATLFVLVGSYWICSDLAKWTEEPRTTEEG